MLKEICEVGGVFRDKILAAVTCLDIPKIDGKGRHEKAEKLVLPSRQHLSTQKSVTK